jgi:transposase
LYFAEHWKVGTIAKQLGVHEDVVRRVTGLHSDKRVVPRAQEHVCGPYAAFIDETLAKYPTLRATRLYDMLKARGYPGSVRTLRVHVAKVRPQPKMQAFLRIESLIAEQAQVDWAHVGRVRVGDHSRDLWCFVLVLAWSRAMFAELVFDLTAASLCRSLVRAGEALGGSPREWLFDNPKTVVLERHGDAVRFHPQLVELAGRMNVQPRLCAVRRPQSKGKVERAIRYLRDRFFDGRDITRIEDGNRELRAFIEQIAHPRQHPRLEQRTVAECLEEERRHLLPLPNPLPATELVIPLRADKTAFVQFDRNRYSVPWERAGDTLTLVANDLEVRVVDGDKEVASHLRRWGKGEVVESRDHRQGLAKARRALETKGRDLLRAEVPRIDELAEEWVRIGRNVGSMTARALRLFELYGPELFNRAVDAVLARGIADLGALAHVCEQLRRARGQLPPVHMHLPSHAKDRDVIPHAMEDYDD